MAKVWLDVLTRPTQRRSLIEARRVDWNTAEPVAALGGWYGGPELIWVRAGQECLLPSDAVLIILVLLRSKGRLFSISSEGRGDDHYGEFCN